MGHKHYFSFSGTKFSLLPFSNLSLRNFAVDIHMNGLCVEIESHSIIPIHTASVRAFTPSDCLELIS